MKIEHTLVDPMRAEAAREYGCTVIVNQSVRAPEQAQMFHIAHMFLHNYFKWYLPKHRKGRTIAWSHLSDPSVSWVLIDQQKSTFFLRTSSGGPALLKRDLRGWQDQPDESASRRAMKKLLHQHGVTRMAAAGVNGCGEPCCCGCKASHHITGEACDLSGLDSLGLTIMKAHPGKYKSSDEAVDAFLAKHHLWRPMEHLKEEQKERWHVEAMQHGLPHLKKVHATHHDALKKVTAPYMKQTAVQLADHEYYC